MIYFDTLKSWLARRRRPVPRPAPVTPDLPGGPESTDLAHPVAMLLAHNEARLAKGLATLAWSTALEAAARGHAETMAAARTMAHAGLADGDLGDRLASAGYRYSRAGENIAEGQADVSAVLAAWMGSPPHRANILGAYAEVGGAMSRDRSGTPYWCVDFGSAAAGFGLVGKVLIERHEDDGISCLALTRTDATKPGGGPW